ncbi:MAG: peptidoglycan DD-metalloendopeptidase family protein [Candidatus Liptonbacteria bacterium]|nr:peptidoglycan DD-metalloendopeptidase family protein [Candidatus Liptonbacteria bacterium]
MFVSVLVFAVLTLNAVLNSASADILRNGVFGGPADGAFYINSGDESVVLYALQNPGAPTEGMGLGGEGGRGLISEASASVYNRGSVFGGGTEVQNGLMVYRVRSGDNLSKIAAQFGISVNTILWANPKIGRGVLSIDEELIILPVSGVLYKTKDGDTLASVASVFGVDVSKIKSANKIENSLELKAGTSLIIPSGKPQRTLASIISSLPQLPSIVGFFGFPALLNSWNWGVLHQANAVDIANVCGTPVYASADGLVLKVGSPDKWNSGYGGFVVLEHNNGTKTTYAHTKENLVQMGDFIEKGAQVAKIGNTGNVHGSTGCHLHFEVEGARNPFVK